MKSYSRHWLSTASLIVFALIATPAQASRFSSLFVFGDSLSDSGNNAAFLLDPPFSLAPSTAADITSNGYVATLPYESRTYSDGDVWVKAVADALGVPSGAAFGPGGGGNFAFGGAETSREIIPLGFPAAPPSLRTQVEAFFDLNGAAPSDGLYVVEGGANNIRRLVSELVDLPTVLSEADAYANDIGDIVDQLQAAGAIDIIVWNAPNAGLSPEALEFGPDGSFAATAASSAFNDALSARLLGEKGVKIFDVFGLFTSVSESPAAFGFTNVTDACGNVALACDLKTSLFWDGIHPTSAGHALLADGVLALAVPVPEPATYAMLLMGLVGCGLAAGRRRSV